MSSYFTLTAEWKPLYEGDEDVFLKVAGLVAYVCDKADNKWTWDVWSTAWRVRRYGTGSATSKDAAKSAAEDFIRNYGQNEA